MGFLWKHIYGRVRRGNSRVQRQETEMLVPIRGWHWMDIPEIPAAPQHSLGSGNEEGGSIHFLGVMVYRKETHADRYLHANSHHHSQQKKIFSWCALLQKADKISDQKDKSKGDQHVRDYYTTTDIQRATTARRTTLEATYQLHLPSICCWSHR